MFNSAKATDSSPPNFKLNSNLNSPDAERYRSTKPHQAKSHAVSKNNSDDEPDGTFVPKDQKKKALKKQIDPNQTPNVSGNPILFYYRLEDANNISTFDSSKINTIWIDANKTLNQMTSTNFYDKSINVLLGGKNSDVLYTNSYSSGTLTINALSPSVNVSNTDNKYIYLRVGLPMNVDIGFEYITLNVTL
jgi:hypothetical protein